MSRVIFFLAIIVLRISICLSVENCESFRAVCIGHTFCGDCLKAHSCCNWCYQESYASTLPRCNVKNDLSSCNKIHNNMKTTAKVIRDEPFTNIEFETMSGIQFKPQELDITLRIDEPINVTIEYRAAKNFPLDLYYLMDLTISMGDALETMKKLGKDLKETLENLTKNYKIAFGSYVDKTTMPFYFTTEMGFENPCYALKDVNKTCSKAYLFKHRLDFTTNTTQFFEKLDQSKLSANIDNVEGGFEALMQILMCGEKMGWLENSRKIIILATESEMHLAGDGLLAGSLKKAPKQCFIDSDGNHIAPTSYDYPSIEEIHRELLRAKTNVIIASKSQSIKYYKELSKVMKDSIFVGLLDEHSTTNVLKLVKDGYYDFIKKIKVFVNTTSIPGVEIKYFVDCNSSGYFVEFDGCSNVVENRPIRFKIQFKLINAIANEYQDVVFLEEKNLVERVQVNLKLMSHACNCPMSHNTDCGEHGRWDCGECKCNEGWQGDNCTEFCTSNYDTCRQTEEDGSVSSTCYNNGYCNCGNCVCYFPFTGAYCEYLCPHDAKERTVCGGPSHGSCLDGVCRCNDGYTGQDCTCSKAQTECLAPGSNTICNGHGTCECNKCTCDKGYGGNFCEICNECEGLCNIYSKAVAQNIADKSENYTINGVNVKMTRVPALKESESLICYYRYEDSSGTQCETRYIYTIEGEKHVIVEMEEPNCGPLASAFTIGGIMLAAIIGIGLLALLSWRFYASRQDRMEYEKFMNEVREQQNSSQGNPLYKSPIVRYDNLLANVNMHYDDKKDD